MTEEQLQPGTTFWENRYGKIATITKRNPVNDLIEITYPNSKTDIWDINQFMYNVRQGQFRSFRDPQNNLIS